MITLTAGRYVEKSELLLEIELLFPFGKHSRNIYYNKNMHTFQTCPLQNVILWEGML